MSSSKASSTNWISGPFIQVTKPKMKNSRPMTSIGACRPGTDVFAAVAAIETLLWP